MPRESSDRRRFDRCNFITGKGEKSQSEAERKIGRNSDP
jgi:hypothetical protein